MSNNPKTRKNIHEVLESKGYYPVDTDTLLRSSGRKGVSVVPIHSEHGILALYDASYSYKTWLQRFMEGERRVIQNMVPRRFISFKIISSDGKVLASETGVKENWKRNGAFSNHYKLAAEKLPTCVVK
jgi:hypothetical protein